MRLRIQHFLAVLLVVLTARVQHSQPSSGWLRELSGARIMGRSVLQATLQDRPCPTDTKYSHLKGGSSDKTAHDEKRHRKSLIFQGYISRSAGSLSMKYRSEAIEVDVNNTDRLLKPGMYAEVELPVSRNTNSLIVPASAIVTSHEKRYVIRSGGGIAHWVDVTEGNSRHDSTEVFGDLRLNDKIIVNANDEIKDGAGIR